MKTKNYLLFFLFFLSYTVSTNAFTYENAEDESILRWTIPSSVTITNIFDSNKSSRIIKFNSATYQYYRFRNSINSSSKNIRWEMKTGNPFFVYIFVQTTYGDRLLYYNGISRNYGMYGTAIHHGLGNNTIDNQWHTFNRDLEADIKEYEPNNEFVSVNSFKIRGINDFSIDNFETFETSILIDTIPPVITLNGDSNITLNQGSIYIEQKASAIDAVDGNVSVSISGTVDSSTIGTYILTYSAIDNSGNSTIKERKINVVATTILNSLVIEDAEDGVSNRWITPLNSTVNNLFDNTKGSRVLRLSTPSYQSFSMKNTFNSSTKEIFQWEMKTANPFYFYIYVETVKGSRLLYYNGISRDYGMSGTAIHHGLGSNSINNQWHTFRRDLDSDIKEYEPDNKFLSISSFKLRSINDSYIDNIELIARGGTTVTPDTAPPIITLNGNLNITLNQGSVYIEQNATAIDAVDGRLDVRITGTVDNLTVGSYTLTYSATDNSGNSASLERKISVVAVVDITPPIITLNGLSHINLIQGNSYSEQNATAIDTIDGELNVTISGTVNSDILGRYIITYSASDFSDNSSSIARVVDVVELTQETTFQIEDAQDTLINGWSVASDATIENTYDNVKESRIIHLYSDVYQYYAMRGLNNREFKKIRWDMKISSAFFVYVDVTTTAGSRLLYYNAIGRDNGLSGSSIHHGLGVESNNGEWQTFTRNLEQDIKDYEPNNELISIDSFKIRAINDIYLDNIELFGEKIVNPDNTPPVITLNGDNIITILQGSTYVEQNATALDDQDGNVSVCITGMVDTSQIRTFVLTYTAVDSTGNSASKTRIVRIFNPNESSYIYTEGFEGQNANNYLVYKSSTNSRFHLGHSNFIFDKSDYTEGNQSLKVEIDIPGLGDNSSWYYYLKIPMNPVFDLEGNLSLSMDVKLSSAALGNVEIGLELPYYPTSSGLKRISSFKNAGIWEHIEMNNIPQETLTDANNWLNRYLYDGNVTDIGRAIDSIVLLIKGTGRLSCSVHLDNIKIGGTQLHQNDFENLYTTRWSNYRTRIRGKIAERTQQRDALTALPDISSFTLCSVENERYNYAQITLARINAILNEMNAKIVNGYFEPHLMEELDGLLQAYEGTVALLEDSLNNQNQKIKILNMPSMKYYRLTGENTPVLSELNGYTLRMTAGEYKSIAMLLVPMCQDAGELHAEISELHGLESNVSSENLDFYIAKLWYQAGLNTTVKVGKFMTQELLLKDENLVKIELGTENNLLKVKYNSSLEEEYISIGRSTDSFPDTKTIVFNDAQTLQPFRFDGSRHKLLWGIIHIPKETTSGEYNATVKIVDSTHNILKEIPININVLSFVLDEPMLKYSLYYIGKLNEQAYPIDSHFKTSVQQLLELKDMKKHGVMYPTSYEPLATLNKTLTLRNEAGLAKDRFYTFGLRADRYSMESIESNIADYQSLLVDNGYLANELYLYANEEIAKSELRLELESLRRVHLAGAKIFTAGYNYFYDVLGDELDMFIYHKGPLNKDANEQVQKWHNSGKEIFTYSAPQVGVENPEVYRRNFGCKLWQKRFDGALNWAYQAKRGAFWNDFDGSSSFREEAFTYPTTNGIVGTIAWEGFREAITDVRYISTLLNLINREFNSGEDVTRLNEFISNIDCNSDLDVLRENIINEIIILKEQDNI
jgi:hypothetical protein